MYVIHKKINYDRGSHVLSYNFFNADKDYKVTGANLYCAAHEIRALALETDLTEKLLAVNLN